MEDLEIIVREVTAFGSTFPDTIELSLVGDKINIIIEENYLDRAAYCDLNKEQARQLGEWLIKASEE